MKNCNCQIAPDPSFARWRRTDSILCDFFVFYDLMITRNHERITIDLWTVLSQLCKHAFPYTQLFQKFLSGLITCFRQNSDSRSSWLHIYYSRSSCIHCSFCGGRTLKFVLIIRLNPFFHCCLAFDKPWVVGIWLKEQSPRMDV